MEKNWKKRWMAGAMAFALCCTTLLQTGASAVSAAEVGGVSAQSETQIEVQTETQTETQTEKSEEELIEETVADPELALMVTEGEAFDIQNDFTGLKLSDGDHVELKKAAMEDGTVFDYNHAGTYKCVYLVTPASGEAYLVARNITVTPREAETDGSNGGQEQETGDDEPEADPVLPTISPEDAPETLEEPEETEEPEEEEAEEFSDEETEDGSHQVDIVQGNEFNIELDHEDGRYQTGETVNFSGDIPQGSLIAVGTSLVEANQTENTEDLLYAEVSYDEGTNSFSFEMPEDDVALSVLYDQAEGGISTMAASDGDLWDDSTDIEANTYYYYSDGKLHPFDSVMGQGGNDSYKYIRYKAGRKTYTVYAYCMQHSKQSPPSGTTYKNMVELDEGGDDRYLRKAMFYGYGGPGWGGTFNGYNIKSIMEKYGCSSETRAMQHYLVDYLYDGESGFGGSLSTTAKNMLKEIKAALAKMPDPTTMELTPGLSASANGNQSPTFTWKANAAFVITIHLENGVSLVNETTGKTGTGNVSVKGGEKFHLEATTQNIGSLKGKYAITSNYPLNFHAMLLKLANSQDIGFGYYTDTLELNLEVDWPDEATVKIIKKDKGSNALLAGAVYGIYADEACTKLIKKMPATNAKGESEVKITKTQDTVYLREISGPSGYVLDTKAYGVKLVVGQTASKNLTDKEQKGALTIYKEGEVLTGATVTEDGVTFAYEKRKLKGAVYSVYAGADIKAADGTLIYKKGALVKDNLVTGDDGSVTLKDLYLGTYTVTETKAPDNYVCKGESKTVELVYAGQTVEVQTVSATFLNERQKAAVRVEKQDEETKNPLSGGIYGLYAAEDIKVDGKTVVPKGTLIEKATTGADGKASYKAELPINYSYSIREIQAPELYLRNSEDTYTFTFKFTNDKEEKVNFSHTFTNKRVNATKFSMVDMYLADKLFASIKSGARLVLVGDKDQIESVGPGKVFQEIIDSGVFPVTVLDECFRQEGNSTISQNAIKINKNQLDLVFDDTFQFIPASTPEEASRKIQKIYRKEVLQRNGSLEEVQVMSPLRKDTEAGTDALNLVLRDIANPKRFGYPEITNGRNTYREGDRVMQTKNNDEVANGDIGEVIGIFRKDQKMVMRVDFGDGRVMEYQEEDYWPLTLAYAITVHKAQGSEYPMAILPMLPCFRWMLRRNIFYTAVTRARERFIIVGSKRAIAQAIRTDYISRRNTMFGYRIRKIYEAILEQEKSA